MIYIEDLIERLACMGSFVFLPNLLISSIDQKYIDSLARQTTNNTGFTEKQRRLALSIVSKHSAKLQKEFNTDIKEILKSPQFKFPVREISSNREISVLDSGVISVKFPFDQSVIESIKKYKKTLPRTEASTIGWDYSIKTWLFPLTENSVNFLSGFNNFEKNDTFLELSKKIEDVKDNIEQYAPMLSYENNTYIFKNTSNRIPDITTDDVVEAVIHARRYGINIWDDTVDHQLESKKYNDVTMEFLKNFTRLPTIARQNVSLYDIVEIIKFSKDILFVIPTGSEFEYLRQTINFLKSLNKLETQVSVLFRLDNQNGKEFNEYVKMNGLNNSLSEETNYIFINSKLPKPLIEARKYFDLILLFGNSPAHYSLKNFIKNNHNVLFMDSILFTIKGQSCLAV